MPTVDPTSANIAAIREQTAIPTTIMIPAQMLFAKNSWLIPRKTALKTPSMLFAAEASAAERSVLETDPAVTCASAGAISPPARPLAKFSAPIRNSSVMKLNASVNGGTFQAPMNTLASAACRIVEKNAPSDDPDHHQRVPVGLQEQRQAGADEDAVEAEQPGADRAAVHPDNERRRRSRRRGRARPAKPSHASPMHIPTRIASPVTGLFMKQTCPTPRRQESTKSSSGFACARSAHAGIVPLIDRPGGEPPPEVLIGVPSSCRARDLERAL